MSSEHRRSRPRSRLKPATLPVLRSGEPFVGRVREPGELRQALADAASGRGRIIVLSGDAGIGKARTAYELPALAVAAKPVNGRVQHPSGLSTREIEILRFLARGSTNAEIGERLFTSPNTAARHLQNILEKSGMANRDEATAWAFRNGLMES